MIKIAGRQRSSDFMAMSEVVSNLRLFIKSAESKICRLIFFEVDPRMFLTIPPLGLRGGTR